MGFIGRQGQYCLKEGVILLPGNIDVAELFPHGNCCMCKMQGRGELMVSKNEEASVPDMRNVIKSGKGQRQFVRLNGKGRSRYYNSTLQGFQFAEAHY